MNINRYGNAVSVFAVSARTILLSPWRGRGLTVRRIDRFLNFLTNALRYINSADLTRLWWYVPVRIARTSSFAIQTSVVGPCQLIGGERS